MTENQLPQAATEQSGNRTRKENPLLKTALDLGPLILFFLTNWLGGSRLGLDETQRIIVATSVFIVATLIALAAGYILTRKISGMTLVSAVLVLFFGALTIIFQDKFFFQLKFTLVNVFFGLLILGGLQMKKNLLSMVLNSGIRLKEEGWNKLAFRWGVFFLMLAGINEILRHMVSWDTWTNIKMFGVMPLMFAFAIAQAPLMMRYEDKDIPENQPS